MFVKYGWVARNTKLHMWAYFQKVPYFDQGKQGKNLKSFMVSIKQQLEFKKLGKTGTSSIFFALLLETFLFKPLFLMSMPEVKSFGSFSFVVPPLQFCCNSNLFCLDSLSVVPSCPYEMVLWIALWFGLLHSQSHFSPSLHLALGS